MLRCRLFLWTTPQLNICDKQSWETLHSFLVILGAFYILNLLFWTMCLSKRISWDAESLCEQCLNWNFQTSSCEKHCTLSGWFWVSFKLLVLGSVLIKAYLCWDADSFCEQRLNWNFATSSCEKHFGRVQTCCFGKCPHQVRFYQTLECARRAFQNKAWQRQREPLHFPLARLREVLSALRSSRNAWRKRSVPQKRSCERLLWAVLHKDRGDPRIYARPSA